MRRITEEATVDGRLRVELFSDAVFAVAITLLVLDLPLRGASGSLLGALADHWTAFAAFGISFVLVGCVWVSHYRLFQGVRHIDGRLLFLNLLVLLTIVLVPFGTSTIATFVTRPGAESHVAAALFAAIMLLMGISFTVLYLVITRQKGSTGGSPAVPVSRVARLRPMVGLIVNSVSIGIAFVNPMAVLALTALVAVYYIVDQLAAVAA